MSDSCAEHLLILHHSMRAGGAERVAAQLAAWWLGQGRRVTLAGSGQDAYALPAGVRRIALDVARDSRGALQALIGNLGRYRAVRRVLREERPDVVVGMMTRPSILALLAAHGLGVPVIATEHSHPPARRLPRFWVVLRRRAYPRAHAVVALTRRSAQWLDAHVPGVRAQVIPNAAIWPIPGGEPVRPAPAPGPRSIVLAVGRLHAVKGFDCLIRAFARLAEAQPHWDLVILGEGPERPALEALRSQLGLDHRIQLPGRVGNVADWYRASSLYVLSSRTEGLPNTLLEAMASGLPCVAFDCETGPSDIIRADVDGVLVRELQDPAALAAALGRLMADPALRARLAHRAPEVLQRFGQDRIMVLWDALLPGRRRAAVDATAMNTAPLP
ncbi:glycosyltransferase family 4 protein [Castellaniella sp.]|uniref:glycosyltransferase family 4 protein n=1 Tax=Castellaniella sp. TaxID=1955812 RepID=UPI00355E4CEA